MYRGGGGRGGGGRGGGGRGRGGRGRGGGGGRGRGAYYKAMYGGGGGGRGRGGGGRGGGRGGGGDVAAPPPKSARPPATAEELRAVLVHVNNRPYPAYKDLYGSYVFDDGAGHRFLLSVDRVQGDAYASPSWFSVEVSAEVAAFPAELYSTPTQRVTLADYLARQFHDMTRRRGIDMRRDTGGWAGVKGGDLVMPQPSQHVLQRSCVTVTPDGSVHARFTVGLPARGRTIVGDMAWSLLGDHTPAMVRAAFMYPSLDAAAVRAHVLSVEDQHLLRASLCDNGLIAFVPNGAILPRASGASDLPLARDKAVPFVSPPEMEVELPLRHGGSVKGMGIAPGVTLIVGGGYHGKSTLLQALEVGVYDKVPGDGREMVVIDPTAVKIRAEDGRHVSEVHIDGFISNLPGGKNTRCFSTPDASGSTSQAASIVEALEVGAKTLLIDEDTAATNFMIRDTRMAMLVSADKEPITPFIARVRELYETMGTSSILVIGGCGEYFEVADRVVQMDAYRPADVTARAKAIVTETAAAAGAGGSTGVAVPSRPFGDVAPRVPQAASIRSDAKVMTRSLTVVHFGEEVLDLAGVEQLVEVGQTRAIADFISRGAPRFLPAGVSLSAALDEVERHMDAANGLDVVTLGTNFSGFARPRRFELAAALNRLRRGQFRQVAT